VAAWNDATDDDRARLFEDIGWGKLPASFRNKYELGTDHSDLIDGLSASCHEGLHFSLDVLDVAGLPGLVDRCFGR